MSDPVELKKYTIDFFKLSFQKSDGARAFVDWCESVIQKSSSPSLRVSGYTREVWEMGKRGKKEINYAGQFRKFRTSDLPEVGSAGEQAAALELAENQGLVERNFFVYYPKRQIIGWCRNFHGSTVNQLCRFLSEIAQDKISAGPLIEPDAMRRLMRNGVSLKRVVLTVPRPTAPDMYAQNDFTKSTLKMMSDVQADSMHISMGIDSRRGDSKGYLLNSLKAAMSEALTLGASTAKATVWEDGAEHPIDLIADRIFSTQEIETNAKYPPSGTMYKAIDDAIHECRGPIDEYFGQLGESVS